MWYQHILISILDWISRTNVAMCNHSCEITLTKFIIDAYVMTRVWNLPSLNMWLLSTKINNWKRFILGSLICQQLVVFFFSFHFYWLPEDGEMLRLRISIFQMSFFFKDLKYFDPGAIYRNQKPHSSTNKFRKQMFVIFSSMYTINVMTCKWTKESTDFTCRRAVLDSSDNL
jgi:hypothetical protein